MTQPNSTPNKDLLQRLKTIMVFRVVILTGFVGLILPLQDNLEFFAPIAPLAYAICGGYLLSLGYALFIKTWSPVTAASVQAVGDLLLVSSLLFTTGGMQSPLSFLFLFVVISSSTVLPRAGCYLVASGASILFGMLIDLEYFQIIHPYYLFHEAPSHFDGGYVFYFILLNIASYYSVAFLSGILNSRLKIVNRELELTSKDLRDLQAFHSRVVRDMGTGLITIDSCGSITSMNRAAEDITGYSLNECLGRECSFLLPIPELKNLLRPVGESKLPFQAEGECIKKDGGKTFIRMKVSRFSPTEEPGKGYICVFEDLTEFRQMQEKISQAEQLAAVGRLSAGLAHEIRNPLASLSGSIQMLSRGLEVEKNHRRLMEIVIDETDRLNSILSDFLNYSNPRKDRNTLVDLTQLIRDVVTLLKNDEKIQKNNRIEFHTGAEHFIVNADEQQIKQLVWNLCINGMQAMDSKGKLTIALEKVPSYRKGNFSSEKRGYVLTIEDEGTGIPPDTLTKIFDPFFTTKDDGVGLGLATVYQIVQRAGGSIDVSSETGKGTRFTVFLPRGVAEPRNELAVSG